MRFVVADRQPSTRSALKLLVEQYPDMECVGSTGDLEGLVKLSGSTLPQMVLVEWELLGASPKISLSNIKQASCAKVAVLSCCVDRSLPLAAGADYYISKVDKPEHLVGVIQDIRDQFAAQAAKNNSII
jgi:DNA-binding NarL/FixJ family response regulator